MNSDLLKQLRKEAGLTQSDMAQKLGYKHKTGYQALESGTRLFYIKTHGTFHAVQVIVKSRIGIYEKRRRHSL